MWQAPNSRAHAVAAARKKAQDRLKNSIHIKRVHAEVKISQNDGAHISEARIVLNDFTPQGVGLFTSEPLAIGEPVALTLEEPRRMYIQGIVLDCQQQSTDSHVISVHKFSYRINIQFTFESEEDRAQIEQYYRGVVMQYIRPHSNAA